MVPSQKAGGDDSESGKSEAEQGKEKDAQIAGLGKNIPRRGRGRLGSVTSWAVASAPQVVLYWMSSLRLQPLESVAILMSNGEGDQYCCHSLPCEPGNRIRAEVVLFMKAEYREHAIS